MISFRSSMAASPRRRSAGSVAPSAVRRVVTRLALAVAATIASGPGLGATTVVPLSDEHLVDGSPVIVEATISARRPARLGGLPATEIEVVVERALKGWLEPGQTIAFVQPGGVSPEGLAVKLWGLPRFAAGGQALLFLRPDAAATGAGARFVLADPVFGGFEVDTAVSTAGLRLARRRLVGVDVLVGQAPLLERSRDVVAFTRWIEDRVAGRRRGADYFLNATESAAPVGATVSDEYSFLTDVDCGDGRPIRWFEFDDGGSIGLRTLQGGQPGIAGGGVSEFQAAIDAWNNDAATPIRYTYSGTTSSGEQCNDAVLFDDPGNAISGSFSGSGTVALGGPCYFCALQSFQGSTYHPTSSVFIVTQDGIDEIFSGGNGPTVARELFAHELGHTLGLGHSAFSSALMFPSLHNPPIGATLSSDERNGIAALYAPAAPAGPPAAPSSLIASAISATSIRLSWSDNANDEAEFRVERDSTDDGSDDFVQIAVLGANAEQYDSTGLLTETTHRFRVRAANAEGPSAYSNVAAATTLDGSAPPPPSAFWLTTPDLSGFRFQVRITSGGDSLLGTDVGACVPDTLCVAGALADRTEAFLRVIGPRPNGKLWPQVVRFTVSQVEAWFEQTATGLQKYYLLPAVDPDSDVLDGISDREGFDP